MQFSSNTGELMGIAKLHAAFADTLNNLHLFPHLSKTSK